MLQDIYTASPTKKYPIGMRYAQDERVFRYCYASGTVIPGWGAFNDNTFEEQAVCVNNQAVGNKVITLTAQENVAEDQFQGGYIGYAGVDTARFHTVRVLSNTEALSGFPFTVTLEHGIPGTMTGTTTVVTCYGSPFSNLQAPTMGGGHAGYSAVMGVPLVDIPAGQYGWIQTWGPIVMIPTAAYGFDTYDTGLVFNGADGSAHIADAAGSWPKMQFAGFILPCSHWDGVGHNCSNGLFLNLMIFP